MGPLGGLEQPAGVAVGSIVSLRAAQHPDDLRDELVTVDPLDRRRCLAARDALLDAEVGPRHRSDLWEVGDAEHLSLLAEGAEPLPDRLGGSAAHAGVDLVEDVGSRATRSALA